MGPTQKIVEQIRFLEVFLACAELAALLSSKTRPLALPMPGAGLGDVQIPPPPLSFFLPIKNGGATHHRALLK